MEKDGAHVHSHAMHMCSFGAVARIDACDRLDQSHVASKHACDVQTVVMASRSDDVVRISITIAIN